MGMFGARNTGNGIKNNQLSEQLKALEQAEDREQNGALFSGISWPEKFTKEQRELFGMALQDARKQAATTQSTLARLCNIPDNYISTLEKGSVARIDKGLVGKIQNILRCDFTDTLKSILAPVRVTSGLTATALPDRLECGEEQTYKVKGSNFELHGNVSETSFSLSMINREGVRIDIFKGNREKNHLFLEAMNKIVSKLNKGM